MVCCFLFYAYIIYFFYNFFFSGINVIANKQNICVTHYALPYEHIKDGLPSGIDGIPQMTHKEFILLRNDVNTILEWLDKNPEWKV